MLGLEENISNDLKSVLQRLLCFAKQYVAALRDNFTSRFACNTIDLCRKFQVLFDPAPYVYPSNLFPTKDPLSDIECFVEFITDIPFVSKSEDEAQTLLFQLCEARKLLLNCVSILRKSGIREQISYPMIIKQVYNELNQDTCAEARHFMSCVITFPVSEAIVESWGSVIDTIVSNKVAFKESATPDMADITEKFAFIKLVGPMAGATYNRKLFKRALILMYGGDYVKHFRKTHCKGFSSKVISRLSSGRPEDSIFS